MLRASEYCTGIYLFVRYVEGTAVPVELFQSPVSSQRAPDCYIDRLRGQLVQHKVRSTAIQLPYRVRGRTGTWYLVAVTALWVAIFQHQQQNNSSVTRDTGIPGRVDCYP